MPASGRPFESLMPLPEVLASCMGVSSSSKKVAERYFALLSALGNELYILRKCPLGDIRAAGGWALEEGIRRLRAGKVLRKSGYDGEYGIISLFAPGELQVLGGQMAMFDMSAAPARGKIAAVKAHRPEATARQAPEMEERGLNEEQRPRGGLHGARAGSHRRAGHGQDVHARGARRPSARDGGQAVSRHGGHVHQSGGAGTARAADAAPRRAQGQTVAHRAPSTPSACACSTTGPSSARRARWRPSTACRNWESARPAPPCAPSPR